MNVEWWLNFFKWVLYAGTAFVAVGTIMINILSSKVDKQKDAKIDELIKGKDQLIKQTTELNSEVTKYQQDLKDKEEQIDKLKVEAKKAARGITSIYDFNGVKRETTRPGHISVTAGAETAVFQNMVQLKKDRNYPELVKVCLKQIADTPEWLTPYLFLGIAYTNLGQKEEAIQQFEYVVKNAPGDPSYQSAAEFLKQLR